MNIDSNDNLTSGWIGEIDYLRGLAFLAVVLQHTLGIYINRSPDGLASSIVLGLLFNLVKFAVPAFVLVSGLVLVYNYRGSLWTGDFYRKRIREILIPYLIWTAIYVNYYSLGEGRGIDVSPGRLVWAAATGNASYHLWFVVLILQFYLLFPLLLPFFIWLGQGSRRTAIFLGAGAALYLILMWISYRYIPGHGGNWPHVLYLALVKYRDRNWIFWYFYFLAGGAAGLYLPQWRRLVNRSWRFNLLIWSFCFLWISWELGAAIRGGRVNLNISTTLKPSMAIYTVSSLFIIYGTSQSWARRGKGTTLLFRVLGEYSLGAYLVHALTLALAVNLLESLGLHGGQHPLVATAIAFALCSLLALAFSWLVNQIPGGSLLVGRGRRKHRAIGT